MCKKIFALHFKVKCQSKSMLPKSHSELVEALYSTENKELTKSVIEDFLMNYKLLLSYYKNSGSGNITLNLAYNAYLNGGFHIKEGYTETLKLFFDTGMYFISFQKLRKSVTCYIYYFLSI